MQEEKDRDKLHFLFMSERLEDLTALAIAALILLLVLTLY